MHYYQLSPRRGWDMGADLCQATGFLLTFLGIASINNLVAISVFRYLVIYYANVRGVVVSDSSEQSQYFRGTSPPTAGGSSSL